jgi:hypothetical protein
MPDPHPTLPQDADALLKLAAQSMFDVFARTAMGMMVVNREHRIVWISEGPAPMCRPPRWRSRNGRNASPG